MIPSLAPVNAYSLSPTQTWCPKPNLNPARRAIYPQPQMQRLEDLMGDLKVALRAAISTTDSAPDGAASHQSPYLPCVRHHLIPAPPHSVSTSVKLSSASASHACDVAGGLLDAHIPAARWTCLSRP